MSRSQFTLAVGVLVAAVAVATRACLEWAAGGYAGWDKPAYAAVCCAVAGSVCYDLRWRLRRLQEYASNLERLAQLLHRMLARRGAEIDRMRRGDFTEEEFQTLCHNFTWEDRVRFAKGCREYQDKLFGRQPPPGKTPQHCPWCCGTDLRTDLVEWSARSLDPQDSGNTARLVEHQCPACAQSLWT